MTRDEAIRIVAALRAGKTYATRYQEQEWGLEVRPDGTFREWRHQGGQDGESSSESTPTEEEVIANFMEWYEYPRTAAGLR